MQLYPLDDLVELEVADKEVGRLAHVADVAGQVVVEHAHLHLVFLAHFIMHQVTLR